MIVPAIVDELNSSETFDEFVTKATDEFGLKVTETIVADKRAVLLTRPDITDPSCTIQDECSITIITEDYDLILKSIDKIYSYGNRFSGIKFNGSFPIFVEEWLPGTTIVSAKHINTILLSTKQHPYGRSLLPGSKQTVESVFTQQITRFHPHSGIGSLYKQDWFNNFSWVFRLVPNGKHLFKIVLISVINMESMEELSLSQVDNLAEYFAFSRPKRITVYDEKQLQEATDELFKNNCDIKGVILSNHSRRRASIKIDNGAKLKLTKHFGVNSELLMLSDCILKGVKVDVPRVEELSQFMYTNLQKLIKELKILYTNNHNVRTRKVFASKIGTHPFAKVLYAVREGKISCIEEFHKVITTKEFIKTLNLVDGKTFSNLIKEYKERLCQKSIK